MALIKVDDGGGSTMTLLEIDGYRVSTFGNKPEDTIGYFRQLPELKCRPDDVLLCATLKCGTHWTWEVLSMIQNESSRYMDGCKMDKMIEARSLEHVDQIPSPRVLNTHLHYSRLPRSAIEQKVKCVFVVRNPKDMLVSWHIHARGIAFYEYDGEFQNFVKLFLENKLDFGNYFEYMLEWERAIKENPGQILLVHYEDMKEDLYREVERMARFLGHPEDPGLWREIAQKCTFEEMAKNREYSQEVRAVFYKGDFSFFRKGTVGGWKDVFTVAQNEMFDTIWNQRMKDSTIKFRYSL